MTVLIIECQDKTKAEIALAQARHEKRLAERRDLIREALVHSGKTWINEERLARLTTAELNVLETHPIIYSYIWGKYWGVLGPRKAVEGDL